MPDTVPAHAEMIDEAQVLKVERRPSRLLPNVSALAVSVHCPGCQKVHDYPGMGHTLVCDGCNLSIQNALRGLFIWQSPPAAQSDLFKQEQRT